MKTALGMGKKEFKRKLNAEIALCVVLGAVVLVLNVLFVMLRTDENHLSMYVLFVSVDIVYGWFLIAFLELSVLPKHRLSELYKGSISKYKGTVSSVSENTVRMRRIDCREIIIGDAEARKFFVPNTLDIKVGTTVIISVISGVVVEVCDE